MNVHTVAGWLAALPALTAAQTQAQVAPPHWAVLWAGPVFLGGALVLLLLRMLHRWPVLRGIGTFFWIVLVTLGGSFSIYAMPKAFNAASWYLPVFFAAFAGFAVAGEYARKKLAAD